MQLMLCLRLKDKYNSTFHPPHIEKYNHINLDKIVNYHNILSWDSCYYTILIAHFQLKENVFFDIFIECCSK